VSEPGSFLILYEYLRSFIADSLNVTKTVSETTDVTEHSLRYGHEIAIQNPSNALILFFFFRYHGLGPLAPFDSDLILKQLNQLSGK
jgi:hypothetical protein